MLDPHQRDDPSPGVTEMVSFAVIEIDDGLTIVEVMPGQSPEDAALCEGGVLIDPGPYHSYEAASDAMDQWELENEQDQSA